MVVGITPTTAEVTVPSLSLVYDERVLTGSLYGSAAPKTDILRMINLYRAGSLKLDELLSRTYRSRRSTRPTTPCSPAKPSAASSHSDRAPGKGVGRPRPMAWAHGFTKI